jgi:hypothetical protein
MENLGKAVMNVAASGQHLIDSTKSSMDRMRMAKYHAKLILGCYRAAEVSDPDVYTTAIMTLLARYPADIGARLSDPKDGVAGRFTWLPTVSEIREECDRLQAADVAVLKRRRDFAEQMQLREEMERPPPRPLPEPRGQILSNYDEAFAKHGRPTGVFEKGRQLPYGRE